MISTGFLFNTYHVFFILVFGISTNCWKMCNLRPFNNGNGKIKKKWNFIIFGYLMSSNFFRFYKQWESLIILDALGAVYAMNVWMVFHSLLTLITKYTVLTITIACLHRNALAVAKVKTFIQHKCAPCAQDIRFTVPMVFHFRYNSRWWHRRNGSCCFYG